jgi:hypothetical protein
MNIFTHFGTPPASGIPPAEARKFVRANAAQFPNWLLDTLAPVRQPAARMSAKEKLFPFAAAASIKERREGTKRLSTTSTTN